MRGVREGGWGGGGGGGGGQSKGEGGGGGGGGKTRERGREMTVREWGEGDDTEGVGGWWWMLSEIRMIAFIWHSLIPDKEDPHVLSIITIHVQGNP